VSLQHCSLAVEEEEEQILSKEMEMDFEPELKVLVKQRKMKDSTSMTDTQPVSIGGRITVSF